jgi:hypothetical protein
VLDLLNDSDVLTGEAAITKFKAFLTENNQIGIYELIQEETDKFTKSIRTALAFEGEFDKNKFIFLLDKLDVNITLLVKLLLYHIEYRKDYHEIWAKQIQKCADIADNALIGRFETHFIYYPCAILFYAASLAEMNKGEPKIAETFDTIALGDYEPLFKIYNHGKLMHTKLGDFCRDDYPALNKRIFRLLEDIVYIMDISGSKFSTLFEDIDNMICVMMTILTPEFPSVSIGLYRNKFLPKPVIDGIMKKSDAFWFKNVTFSQKYDAFLAGENSEAAIRKACERIVEAALDY